MQVWGQADGKSSEGLVDQRILRAFALRASAVALRVISIAALIGVGKIAGIVQVRCSEDKTP